MIDGFLKGWEVGAAIAGEVLGLVLPTGIVFASALAGSWFLVRKLGL